MPTVIEPQSLWQKVWHWISEERNEELTPNISRENTSMSFGLLRYKIALTTQKYLVYGYLSR